MTLLNAADASPNGVALFRPKSLIPPAQNTLKIGLEELGCLVFEFSLLKHALTHSPPPKNLSSFDAYLFSSVTALEALQLNERLEFDVTKPVLAVGEQTAKAAHDYGFQNVCAGDAGMVSLFEGHKSWPSALQTSSSILYIGVTDPKHDPSNLNFLETLSPSTQAFVSRLKFERWAIYKTISLTGVVDGMNFADQLEIDLITNLSKIKYFSFFSQRNAAVFSQFLKTRAVQKGTRSSQLAELLLQKTLICNSPAIAKVIENGQQEPVFGAVKISEKPSRDSYLKLMSALL